MLFNLLSPSVLSAAGNIPQEWFRGCVLECLKDGTCVRVVNIDSSEDSLHKEMSFKLEGPEMVESQIAVELEVEKGGFCSNLQFLQNIMFSVLSR